MLIELACDVVGNQRAPLEALLQLDEMVLKKLKDRPNPVGRITEETEQQLHRAVSRATTHSSNRRIKAIGALNNGFDGVRECELLIVVGVDPHFFSRPLKGGRP